MESVLRTMEAGTVGTGEILRPKSVRVPILVACGAIGLGLGALAMMMLTPKEVPAPPAPAAESKPAAEKVEVATVSAERLKERMERERDLLVAFVGSKSYFDERRIPGAICVPYAGIEANFGSMNRERAIVLYCGCCAGDSDGISGNAARRLMDMGFRNVAHLRGHFAAWQSMRYRCEGTNPETPVERAFENARQKEQLDAFVSETGRRRVELATAIAAERNPERKSEMERRLAETDREAELRGLELKRRISEENGDVQKVKEIDELIEARRKKKQ
jgi:phage shock protein E